MSTTTPNDPLVSNTILRQLGGQRFLVMTGARDLVYDTRSLTMRLPKTRRADKKAPKWITIRLTDADVYELTAIGADCQPIETRDDIFAQQLCQTFEAMTGLAVSL